MEADPLVGWYTLAVVTYAAAERMGRSVEVGRWDKGGYWGITFGRIIRYRSGGAPLSTVAHELAHVATRGHGHAEHGPEWRRALVVAENAVRSVLRAP